MEVDSSSLCPRVSSRCPSQAHASDRRGPGSLSKMSYLCLYVSRAPSPQLCSQPQFYAESPCV